MPHPLRGVPSLRWLLAILFLLLPSGLMPRAHAIGIVSTPSSITGTITDSTTKSPLFGATVDDGNGQATTTDGNGKYTLTNVGVGTFPVTASLTGYTSKAGNVTVNSGKTSTYNVALSVAPGSVSGTVTDIDTGLGIKGAMLQLQGLPGGKTSNVTSGVGGVYTFASVPPGALTLVTSAKYYLSESDSITVTAASTTSDSPALYESVGAVSGTVTDASTKAVLTGATVTLTDASSNVVGTTTTNNGFYGLPNITAGAYTLTVDDSANSYNVASKSVTVLFGRSLTANFALTPTPGSVSGTVVVVNSSIDSCGPFEACKKELAAVSIPGSSLGIPIAGATVAVFNSSGMMLAHATSASDGTYTVANVAPGADSITVTAPNYVKQTGLAVNVQPGPNTGYDLFLTPNNAVLFGAVSSGGGFTVDKAHVSGFIFGNPSALPGATVQLLSSKGVLLATTTSDANGLYCFLNLKPATYTVAVTASGFVTQSHSVQLGLQDVQQVGFPLLPVASTISGNVIDSVTRAIISGATVTDGSQTTQTDGNGNYTLTEAPGTYSLTFSDANYASDTITGIVVASGLPAGAGGVLTPNAGSITGIVTDSLTGNPIQTTVLLFEGAALDAQTTSDPTGSYTFSPLTEGSYSVQVNITGYQAFNQTVNITPGDDAIVLVALTPLNATINGSVTDSSTGAGIGGATVSDGVGDTTTTASNGSGDYTLSVPEGTYSLTCSATGYVSQTVTGVTIGPGGTITESVQLVTTTGTISGVVTDAVSGGGISGASVIAGGQTTTTDGNGSYSLTEPAGTYTLDVSAIGYSAATVSGVAVTAGANTQENVALTLQPTTGSIQAIVFVDGNADPSLSLFITTINEANGDTITPIRNGGSGTFVVPGLVPGQYSVLIDDGAQGFHSVKLFVTVTAGNTTSLVFNFF